MQDIDTKEKLKKLFDGKSEQEIDKAVVALKQVLDEAAEEAKGDKDIEDIVPELLSHVKISPIKKHITEFIF